MALDTRNKRASALGIDSPFLRVFPNPSGTIDEAARQQISAKYSGISSGGIGASAILNWILMRRRRRR